MPGLPALWVILLLCDCSKGKQKLHYLNVPMEKVGLIISF